MNPGQDLLNWDQDIWHRINQAVHDESKRTRVAAKFLPLYGPVAADTTEVPSDEIEDPQGEPLYVDPTVRTPLIEIWVKFTLTEQQVAKEEELGTTVTLATRAANILAQAEDALLFQGQTAIEGRAAVGNIPAIPPNQWFAKNGVGWRQGPAGTGLLGEELPSDQVFLVERLDDPDRRYGENTFKQISAAYSQLQKNGHYGPYAIALYTEAYADTHAPLKNTLIMPADRIKPLLHNLEDVHFYGTGTLPVRGQKQTYTGVMVSLGGNTMDLVRPSIIEGADMITEVLPIEEGLRPFRIFERFALRLKDKTAVIRLDFEHGRPKEQPERASHQEILDNLETLS